MSFDTLFYRKKEPTCVDGGSDFDLLRRTIGPRKVRINCVKEINNMATVERLACPVGVFLISFVASTLIALYLTILLLLFKLFSKDKSFQALHLMCTQ